MPRVSKTTAVACLRHRGAVFPALPAGRFVVAAIKILIILHDPNSELSRGPYTTYGYLRQLLAEQVSDTVAVVQPDTEGRVQERENVNDVLVDAE